MKIKIEYVDGAIVLNNFRHLVVKNNRVIMSYTKYGIDSCYEYTEKGLKKVFPSLDELLAGYNHADPSQGKYIFFKRVPYSIGKKV